jgi:rubrerythrin
MKIGFDLDEVFELAVQIEKNGVTFYRAAATLSAEQDARALFEKLAEQELAHEQTFSRMRQASVPESARVASFDKNGDLTRFLRGVAGQYVFNVKERPEDALKVCRTAADVLRLAIDREKDSLVLYGSVLEALHNEKDSDSIWQIIREERRHIVLLSDLLAKLAGTA